MGESKERTRLRKRQEESHHKFGAALYGLVHDKVLESGAAEHVVYEYAKAWTPLRGRLGNTTVNRALKHGYRTAENVQALLDKETT